MNTRLVAILLILMASYCPVSHAAALSRYEFNGSFADSASALGVSVTVFLSGPALTDVNLNGDGQPPDSWFGKNWETSSDPAVALSSDSYVSFRITTQPGMQMTFSELSIDVRPHGSGPRDFIAEVRGFGPATASVFSTVMSHPDQNVYPDTYKTWSTLSIASDAFQDMVGEYEVRIYGFDAPQADQEVLFDNVVLRGTVSPVPEPSVLSLLAVAGVVWRCAIRRRD